MAFLQLPLPTNHERFHEPRGASWREAIWTPPSPWDWPFRARCLGFRCPSAASGRGPSLGVFRMGRISSKFLGNSWKIRQIYSIIFEDMKLPYIDSSGHETSSEVEVLGCAIDRCLLGCLGLSLHLCSQLCHGRTHLTIRRRRGRFGCPRNSHFGILWKAKSLKTYICESHQHVFLLEILETPITC